MNPLSDLGMSDLFWDKYRKICTISESKIGRCGCGSGLPMAEFKIPIWTKKNGVTWAVHHSGPDNCLACQTRLMWRMATDAGDPNPHLLCEKFDLRKQAADQFERIFSNSGKVIISFSNDGHNTEHSCNDQLALAICLDELENQSVVQLKVVRGIEKLEAR